MMLDKLTSIKIDLESHSPNILINANPVRFKDNEITIGWTPKYVAIKNSKDIKEAYIKILEILIEEAKK